MTKNEKIYVTINEFASITGLSRTFIRECCKSEKAAELKVNVKPLQVSKGF